MDVFRDLLSSSLRHNQIFKSAYVFPPVAKLFRLFGDRWSGWWWCPRSRVQKPSLDIIIIIELVLQHRFNCPPKPRRRRLHARTAPELFWTKTRKLSSHHRPRGSWTRLILIWYFRKIWNGFNETRRMGVKRKIEVLNERDVESRAPHTRAVSKRAGVLCVRGSKVYIGTKIQIRAKQIFVKRATLNNVL